MRALIQLIQAEQFLLDRLEGYLLLQLTAVKLLKLLFSTIYNQAKFSSTVRTNLVPTNFLETGDSPVSQSFNFSRLVPLLNKYLLSWGDEGLATVRISPADVIGWHPDLAGLLDLLTRY